MLIVGARNMLIVGTALFRNRCTNYQHENVDTGQERLIQTLLIRSST